ncbi:hypothetical protein ACC771_20415, partial [Rhizobium ruizarguesonis]
ASRGKITFQSKQFNLEDTTIEALRLFQATITPPQFVTQKFGSGTKADPYFLSAVLREGDPFQEFSKALHPNFVFLGENQPSGLSD